MYYVKLKLVSFELAKKLSKKYKVPIKTFEGGWYRVDEKLYNNPEGQRYRLDNIIIEQKGKVKGEVTLGFMDGNYAYVLKTVYEKLGGDAK